MTASESDRLMFELTTIGSYLTAAEDVVKSGHMPDMTGLESRVALLCEAIQAAEPDIQKRCLPELVALLEKLALCEQAIRDSQVTKTRGLS